MPRAEEKKELENSFDSWLKQLAPAIITGSVTALIGALAAKPEYGVAIGFLLLCIGLALFGWSMSYKFQRSDPAIFHIFYRFVGLVPAVFGVLTISLLMGPKIWSAEQSALTLRPADTIPVQGAMCHKQVSDMSGVAGRSRKLNVTLAEVTDNDVADLHLSARLGAKVTAVPDSAPSNATLLRIGDVILCLDGYKIAHLSDIGAVLDSVGSKSKVEVGFSRGGNFRTANANLF